MNLAVPLNAIYGLVAAVLWGGGDFTGGMGVKATGGSMRAALRIVLMSHTISLILLAIAVTLRHDPLPHGAPLAWAIGSGLMGNISVCIFYIALSRGAMGASAAVSGLLAAAIPAVVSSAIDGAPGLQRLCGFCLAGIAIWLIAAAPGESTASGNMLLASLSGAGFGLYFVALKFAGAAGVVAPMGVARFTSVCFCCVLLTILAVTDRRRGGKVEVRIGRSAVLWSAGTALMDTSGNMFFIGATRAGRLDVASVLASLYPATTILLAAWTLKETPTRRQGVGMLLAAISVVLITI